jgi:hypothetical protein
MLALIRPTTYGRRSKARPPISIEDIVEGKDKGLADCKAWAIEQGTLSWFSGQCEARGLSKSLHR